MYIPQKKGNSFKDSDYLNLVSYLNFSRHSSSFTCINLKAKKKQVCFLLEVQKPKCEMRFFFNLNNGL